MRGTTDRIVPIQEAASSKSGSDLSPSPFLPMRHRQGFTVLELIVVMVIAGLVGAISMGRFSSIMMDQRMNRATKAVQNDLQGAFGLAVRNRVPIRISWDTTTMQIGISNRAKTIYYRRVGLGPNTGLNFNPSNVTFYPDRGVEVFPNGLSTDTLSITIQATLAGTTLQRRIWMSRAGLIQVK